jgi:hypothetical protein
MKNNRNYTSKQVEVVFLVINKSYLIFLQMVTKWFGISKIFKCLGSIIIRFLKKVY